MTRERKIAIQMWEEVKEQLPFWPREDIALYLKHFKQQFCEDNGVYWRYSCWFCQYTRDDCRRCPLRSCNHHNLETAWARIVNESSALDTRLKACDEIIAALKGVKNGNSQ